MSKPGFSPEEDSSSGTFHLQSIPGGKNPLTFQTLYEIADLILPYFFGANGSKTLIVSYLEESGRLLS